MATVRTVATARCGLALLAMFATVAPAQAQPVPAPVADADARARDAYRAGEAAYAAGDYAAAIVAFTDAYQLSARPAILFNLAGAHERVAAYAEAAAALRRFLPDAPPADVAVLRQRVARLDERAAAAGEARRQQDETARALAALRRRSPTSAGTPRSTLLLAGTAVAATVGSASFLAVARDAHSAALAHCTAGGLCTTEARVDLDRERRYLKVSALSAAIAVSAGATSYLLWRRARRASTTVVPELGTDHAAIWIDGHF